MGKWLESRQNSAKACDNPLFGPRQASFDKYLAVHPRHANCFTVLSVRFIALNPPGQDSAKACDNPLFGPRQASFDKYLAVHPRHANCFTVLSVRFIALNPPGQAVAEFPGNQNDTPRNLLDGLRFHRATACRVRTLPHPGRGGSGSSKTGFWLSAALRTRHRRQR